ncbi:MAG: hypothetical protein CMF55_01515 [Legionellales bacterium]|nr:hypothetical protein [Legionellales bacterium]
MKKYMMIVLCLLLVGCSHPSSIQSPCNDFGKRCHQVPVNTWFNDGSTNED